MNSVAYLNRCQSSEVINIWEPMDLTNKSFHRCHFENCGRIFNKLSNLAIHLNKNHAEEHPYNFPVRIHDKKFTRNEDSETNNGQDCKVPKFRKIHVCLYEKCGKIFENTSMLKRHMIIHIGEKNYSCQICGYKSFWKDNFDRHVKTQHKENTIHLASYAATKHKENSSNLTMRVEIQHKENSRKIFRHFKTRCKENSKNKVVTENHDQIKVQWDSSFKHQLQHLDLWWPKDLEKSFLASTNVSHKKVDIVTESQRESDSQEKSEKPRFEQFKYYKKC